MEDREVEAGPDPVNYRLARMFTTQKITSILVFSELVTKALAFENHETKTGLLNLLSVALEKSIKTLVDLNPFKVHGNIMVLSKAYILCHKSHFQGGSEYSGC